MAFRTVNFNHLAKFNSATSSDLIDIYDKYVNDAAVQKLSELPHKTFAPSSARCLRRSWFRIRGVQPDTPKPDKILNFTAQIGEACHRIIQSNLKAALGSDWITPREYLAEHPIPYEYELDEGDLETRIEIKNPPVRFACDGILRLNDKYYLLEIKTSEYSSFDKLTDPKPHHIAQVKYYCTMLGIHDVIFMYQDRQYGDIKCYEFHVSDFEMESIRKEMNYVMDMVEANLPPDKLPAGDAWCQPSQCQYYEVCKRW